MIIKGGRVIDPVSERDEVSDIKIENGKIVKIAKNIDGSKLVIVKNQGHRLARTAPEIFNKLVYDFLEGRLWKNLKNINKVCLIFYFWY